MTSAGAFTPSQIKEQYADGNYNTIFLEDLPNESQLIFKLQQRKTTKCKTIAEHVVGQLNPEWKSGVSRQRDEKSVLTSELKEFFKLTRDSRIIDDLTYFKVTADKKVTVQVDRINNLAEKGSLVIIQDNMPYLYCASRMR